MKTYASQPISNLIKFIWASILATIFLAQSAGAAEAPRIVKTDGHYALYVDGRPFLILGGQIHNSSGWPSELPQVWDAMADLHANTVEAPVYWEQMEPKEGQFEFSNVDRILEGAKAHNLHVVLLWFGTWKNGNMHYVPSWVKSDSQRFPRVIRSDGEPIDVLSAMSAATLRADQAAFTRLMHHLRDVDKNRTVIMVQVENESGIVGGVRDFSAASEQLFNGPVPADLLKATGKSPGTWHQVFGSEADEIFQVYYQARFMNQIVASGKAEFDVPMYINVWLNYPVQELPERQLDHPGVAYPSGGAWQRRVDLWKALAPSIDVIAPDFYSDDSEFLRKTMAIYNRPDNPLWIPETGSGGNYGKVFYYALGQGAIGVAPFGVDLNEREDAKSSINTHARNFALVSSFSRELALWSMQGKVRTAVEEPGAAEQEIKFGDWEVSVGFGHPILDGRRAPGTKDAHGTAIVVRLADDVFLVTGIDASFFFHLPGRLPWSRSEIITAEEGTFENGQWKPLRLLNGDETDRGIQTFQVPTVVKIKLGKF